MSTITFRMPSSDAQLEAYGAEFMHMVLEANAAPCAVCGSRIKPGHLVAIQGAGFKHVDCFDPKGQRVYQDRQGEPQRFDVDDIDPFEGPAGDVLLRFAQAACSAYSLLDLDDKDLLALHIDAWEVASDVSAKFGAPRSEAYERFWQHVERISALTREQIAGFQEAA